MSEALTLLKLGGSVITVKEKLMTSRMKVIKRLAKEVKEANVERLIIVHGGGGFAHPIAAKYKIKEGYRSASQLIGVARTHQSMLALNNLVVDAFVDQGVPAISFQPFDFIIAKDARILDTRLDGIKKALGLGMVPILFGDVVLDLERGFTIVSGDQLISSLATRLNASRVIIAIDVDGLYTADPHTDPSATLIEEISFAEMETLQAKIAYPRIQDVTGGMAGKIGELTLAAKEGIPILIVNGLKPRRVYRALKGEEVIGTIIRAETIG